MNLFSDLLLREIGGLVTMRWMVYGSFEPFLKIHDPAILPEKEKETSEEGSLISFSAS